MAGQISLCLASCYVLDPLSGNASYEKDYAEMLKPLLSCMCANAGVSFSLYLSGEAVEWIDRHHPEFFSIAGELISKKTLEIIGGGFFAPYFPFIPAGDRVMQIEMLTTAIRKTTGKKPRGAWLPSSAWDSSMIPILSSCGIEYVFIDRLMLKHSGYSDADGSFPVLMEENGKAITAVSLETAAEIQNPEESDSPRRFCESLSSLATTSDGAAFAFFIKPEMMRSVLSGKNPWLSRLFDFASTEDLPVCFGTAYQIVKSSRFRQQWTILPSGMSPSDVRMPPEGWDVPALAKIPVKQNIMNSSPFAFGLYAKMMYVHTLVNQVRGDKARKNSAREELCRAQNYLHFSRTDTKKAAASMVYVYKKLLAAEKLTRQRGVFSDSLASFDYDFDGQKEYLSQTQSHNMYLHTSGGKIFECDVFSSGRNFCAFSGRSAKASGEGFFVDYFIAKDDLHKILNFHTDSLPEVFSSNFYQEDFVDTVRREVALKTCGLYGRFEQPVALKKRFLFTKTGIQVQFILKNDSPMNLSGIFATALNFMLSIPKKTEPAISVFSCETRQNVSLGLSEYPQTEWILISDSDGGTEFKIEANENPDAALCFSGGGSESKSALSVAMGKTLSVFLCWQTELSPGYETEKTVFLTIKA